MKIEWTILILCYIAEWRGKTFGIFRKNLSLHTLPVIFWIVDVFIKKCHILRCIRWIIKISFRFSRIFGHWLWFLSIIHLKYFPSSKIHCWFKKLFVDAFFLDFSFSNLWIRWIVWNLKTFKIILKMFLNFDRLSFG